MEKIDLSEFIRKSIGVPYRELGRDFTGLDCWGLIVRAYQDIFNINLPDFSYLADLKYQEAEKGFADLKKSFIEIPFEKELSGDLLLFRGIPLHAALVAKRGYMLHVEKGLQTCIELYTGLWQHRLIGIYRHEQLTGHN